jgi:hypothetical protein
MPAPTALIKPVDTPPAAVPADDVEIADAAEDLEMDPEADMTLDQDHQMDGTAAAGGKAIALFDEEGRPIFAPIKDVVRRGRR